MSLDKTINQIFLRQLNSSCHKLPLLPKNLSNKILARLQLERPLSNENKSLELTEFSTVAILHILNKLGKEHIIDTNFSLLEQYIEGYSLECFLITLSRSGAISFDGASKTYEEVLNAEMNRGLALKIPPEQIAKALQDFSGFV